MFANWISTSLLLSAVLGFVVTGALECYSCDSSEDAECATSPGQQLSVEECTRVDDECVTAIVAGITRRGCLSRLYPNLYCAAPCNRCNSSLCNRHIFPVDRLRCYQCVGTNCVDVSGKSALLLPCPVYHEEDRCYTNVIGLQNVQRGCERTNLPAGCPHVCLKCNYDGCNNEQGAHEQHCLQCSHSRTSPNPDCLRQQQTPAYAGERCALATPSNSSSAIVKRCSNQLMHGHTGKCFTYVNEQTDVVQRGCSTTMGFYPTGTLRQCYGEQCNDECLDVACHNCTSVAGSSYNCRLGVNLRSQKCAAGTFGCYSCEKGAQVRRGCADDAFQPQANEACYVCHNADGCNRASVRTCYHCSSLENPECNSWTVEEPRIAKTNCSTPNELCVSTLATKFSIVYTIRGCAAQVPECTDNDPFCARCNGSLCNTEALSWPFNAAAAAGHESEQLQRLRTARSGQTRLGPVWLLLLLTASLIWTTCSTALKLVVI